MIDGSPREPGRLSLADVPEFARRIVEQTEAQLRAGVAVVAVEETFKEAVYHDGPDGPVKVKDRWAGTIFAVLVGTPAVEWEAERLAHLQAENARRHGETPEPRTETPVIGVDPAAGRPSATAQPPRFIEPGTAAEDCPAGRPDQLTVTITEGGGENCPYKTSPPPAATPAGAGEEVSTTDPAGAPPGEGGN